MYRVSPADEKKRLQAYRISKSDQEAARLLRISPDTFCSWRISRKLPSKISPKDAYKIRDNILKCKQCKRYVKNKQSCTYCDNKKSIKDRFLERCTKTETCWIWTSTTKGDDHRGVFSLKSKDGKKLGFKNKPNEKGMISVMAYRVAYVLYKDKIPKGYHIDHICRNPICVNPFHLEAVTPQTNSMRGLAARLWPFLCFDCKCKIYAEEEGENVPTGRRIYRIKNPPKFSDRNKGRRSINKMGQ